MCSIAERLEAIRATIPQGVELVAVSKFHPVEKLRQAYDAGQRVFGESRVPELVAKHEALPGDVRWHFIGHLQTNKVKPLIGRVSLIESADSMRLLECIDRHSVAAGVRTRVLVQVHVAAEETKFGFDPDELTSLFANGAFSHLQAVDICGIMGMATNTDDPRRIAADFGRIRDTFAAIRTVLSSKDKDNGSGTPRADAFSIISMGMSHDYRLAIDCGSTMVRIGTAIFGDREY